MQPFADDTGQICMAKILLCLFLLLISSFGQATTSRRVEGNVLISDSLPSIRIQVDQAFHFLGSFPFQIQNIAAGHRFVFVDADNQKVRRMFIAQFESILPESTEIYRYNFDNAIPLGGFRFRHNTFAFSFEQDVKENPHKESALTKDFLHKKNYDFPDEWMASRFLALGDESRIHEMILFYMESVDSTGHTIKEFYDGDTPTDIWQKISKELDKRSRAAFQIL